MDQRGRGRVGGDAEDVDVAGGVFDDEERVEPGQGDGVDAEQVAGEDRVGLGAEELRPGRPGSLWRRVDPAAVRIFQMVEAPIW
jgi:hypothetical protein